MEEGRRMHRRGGEHGGRERDTEEGRGMQRRGEGHGGGERDTAQAPGRCPKAPTAPTLDRKRRGRRCWAVPTGK